MGVVIRRWLPFPELQRKNKEHMMNLVSLEDFEAEAKSKLNKGTWSFFSSGDHRQFTARDNIDAFSRYLIRPRVLHDVSHVDISTTVLGDRISFPVGVAPSAFHCLAHHDGEKATARACWRSGTCMIPSSWGSVPLEEISASANGDGLRWMHVSFMKDREVMLRIIRRAEVSGYRALVVTLDTPVRYRKKPDIRNKFSIPPHISLRNFELDSLLSYGEKAVSTLVSAEVSWESIDWLRSITSLSIVLKGILRTDDAREAIKHNIQGIIVSNHGGRKLDTVPASIDALPGVVHAVEGSGVEVYLDGGIRHGTDVLKALALGARAVFIGRPVLYGLACNGEDGVYQLLNILKDEVRQAFTLSGCRNITEVQTIKDLVVHSSYFPKL